VGWYQTLRTLDLICLPRQTHDPFNRIVPSVNVGETNCNVSSMAYRELRRSSVVSSWLYADRRIIVRHSQLYQRQGQGPSGVCEWCRLLPAALRAGIGDTRLSSSRGLASGGASARPSRSTRSTRLKLVDSWSGIVLNSGGGSSSTETGLWPTARFSRLRHRPPGKLVPRKTMARQDLTVGASAVSPAAL